MTLSTTVNIYGKIPTNPEKSTIRSKDSKVLGTSYPPSYGKNGGYFSKSSGTDLVRNNLRQLLQTQKGERVMLPGFGTNLRKYVMEPMDETLFSLIKKEISESIYKYLPNVQLLKIKITPNNQSYLTIGLYCKIKDPSTDAFNLLVEIK